MTDFRWQGYTHQELYTNLNSGPGAAAAAEPITHLTNVSKALGVINQDMVNAIKSTTHTWEGAAAEAARNAFSALAKWATDAQPHLDNNKNVFQKQGDLLTQARANMPAPVPAANPEQSSGLFGGLFSLIDAEVTEWIQNTAAAKAVQVMEQYHSNSSENTKSFSPIPTPPQVVHS